MKEVGPMVLMKPKFTMNLEVPINLKKVLKMNIDFEIWKRESKYEPIDRETFHNIYPTASERDYEIFAEDKIWSRYEAYKRRQNWEEIKEFFQPSRIGSLKWCLKAYVVACTALAFGINGCQVHAKRKDLEERTKTTNEMLNPVYQEKIQSSLGLISLTSSKIS